MPVLLVGLALALGIGLRIAASQGSMGVDELWSLRQAVALPRLGDAFWGLPHDNNHPLNTAVLALLGPDQPVWLYRVPALLLGSATVLAMARLLAGSGAMAAMAGALLMATSLPFVDFGSEARGYAGLVLASVIAIGQWRRAMAAQGDRGPAAPAAPGRWGLAAAAGLGTFCHVAMMMSVAVLAAATAVLFIMRRQRPARALRAGLTLFAPTVAALVPALLCLVVSIERGGGLRMGDVDPFSPAKLLQGLGSAVTMTLGMPSSNLAPLFCATVLACLAAAARRRLLGSTTAALGVAAFVVLPAALWAARMPNVGYARYYAMTAVVLVMAIGETAGGLWSLGRRSRLATLAGLSAVVIFSLMADRDAIRLGRSPASATLAILRAAGAPDYASDRPAMAALMLGIKPRLPSGGAARPKDRCPAPAWFIAVGTFDSRPSGTVVPTAPACPALYRAAVAFDSNPLSGTPWTLYRLASDPSGTMTVSPGSGT